MSILPKKKAKKISKKEKGEAKIGKKCLQRSRKCAIMNGIRGIVKTEYALLAQMDRAQASDAWCRRFESAIVRQKSTSFGKSLSILSKPTAWHVIDARSAAYVIRPKGGGMASRNSVHVDPVGLITYNAGALITYHTSCELHTALRQITYTALP